MSATGNWPATAIATYWKSLGIDEGGDSLGFAEPVQVMCDYGGDVTAQLAALGISIVVKMTFWTEFPSAAKGDYMMIGASTTSDPLEAGADEVMHAIRWADTFDRIADDYAIITGV